jgi:hypothetical protein
MAPISVSQASFHFGDYQAVSNPYSACTKELSRKLAAQGLLKTLNDDLKSGRMKLYFGSPEFNLRISGLWKLLHGYGIHEINYKLEKVSDQLYSCIASIQKGKRIVEARIAYHQSNQKVKVFAQANLFEEIYERMRFVNLFEEITKPTYELLVKDICKKRNITVAYNERILNQPYIINSCTARAIAQGEEPLFSMECVEVYKSTARERASKHLYNLLMATNFPLKVDATNGPTNYCVELEKFRRICGGFKQKKTEVKDTDGNWNISITAKITRFGKVTEIESKIHTCEKKIDASNLAAKELLTKLKEFFDQKTD